MGRVETVDTPGAATPGRRLEQQKDMKDTQFALKWVGKGSPDRIGVEAIGASPTKQSTQKADTGHRYRNPCSSPKPRESASVRTKAQVISRESVPEAGRIGGRIIEQNPAKGEAEAFELFKKDFIEKLAGKAKERPGYLIANDDFVKQAKGSPKSAKQRGEKSEKSVRVHPELKQTDEDFIESVEAHPKPKQTGEDSVKPVKDQPELSTQTDEVFAKPEEAQPKRFTQTESLEPPSSVNGLPNSRKYIVGRTGRIIESSRTLLQSLSQEKRKSSFEESFSNPPKWMSKYEKLNLSLNKQTWSRSTSKDFILNKFFQTPTKPAPSSPAFDVYPTDEEATPQYTSRRRVLSTEHNASDGPPIVMQPSLSREGEQILGQTTVQSEQWREDRIPDSTDSLAHQISQTRSDVSRISSNSPRRSPGRSSSSDDRRKDLSRSPRRRLPSDDRRKDSSRSPGRTISSEEERNSLSRSPGRRLLTDVRKQDLSQSSASRSSSEKRRNDSSQTFPTSTRSVLAAEDLGTRTRRATRVPNENAVQCDFPDTRTNLGRSRDKGSDNESQPESVKRDRAAMLKALKVATAVDQEHFIRALQDNGAVQSSTPVSTEVKQGFSSFNDTALQRPSSPSRTTHSNNLQEARGTCRVEERRAMLSQGKESPTRGLSSAGRREVGSFGSSTRSRDQSPTGRKDVATFGSSTRSREPSPTGRKEATSGPTNAGIAASRRSQSVDGSSENSSSRSAEFLRIDTGERSQLPSGGNSPSCGSPRFSCQSSSRSIASDDNVSVSGSSIIERLMRKASLRNRSNSAANQAVSLSVPASPDHRFAPPSDTRTGFRRSLSFVDIYTDIIKTPAKSSPRKSGTASPPTCSSTIRSSSIEADPSEADLPRKPSETISVSSTASEQLAASAPEQQHPLNNSLRVNVQVKESTIAKLKSRRILASPIVSDAEKVTTIQESCHPIATPERTLFTVTSGGSPWSPGSDDSSSEASGIEQPSPVSVLSYNNNRRTPFQEDSRLSPLEHKLQVLHERVRKSKTDVANQKKARLDKIKASEAELKLCVVAELQTDKLLGVELPKVPKVPRPLSVRSTSASEEKKSLPGVVSVTGDEKLEKARSASPIPDVCSSLETFDLRNLLPWAQNKKLDLVYIRDVLLVSNFGRDRSTMTKWHSVVEPMDPGLFEKLEEFYRLGKKFPGCQFLSSLTSSQDWNPSMQEYVQRIFFNPVAMQRGAVDAMRRCHLFDAVNEALARKLVPYVGLPRPWMKPLSKPVVRPRPTGSALMQEIWTDICGQVGNNGSMSMDKAQLHQSLEDLISEDLFKRTEMFPTREVERVAERVGIELERRILDDLIEETVTSLMRS